VARPERPLSIGLALTTTWRESSSRISPSSAKLGRCV